MRRFIYLFLDLALMASAGLFSLVLRENFNLSTGHVSSFIPYLCVLLLISAVVFSVLGLHKSIWRLSGLPDYIKVAAAVVLSVATTTALLFIVTRMDGIARSLPIIQMIVGTGLLVLARVAMRLRHRWRQTKKQNVAQFSATPSHRVSHVLLVGSGRAAKYYVQLISELAPARVHIAGLLGKSEGHVGRSLDTHKILGRPEDVASIINDLANHGVMIDHVVITVRAAELSDAATRAIRQLECNNAPVISWLEDLTIGRQQPFARPQMTDTQHEQRFQINPDDLAELSSRPFWAIKRAVDIVFSAMLLVVLFPLIICVAGFVAVAFGAPILFWQVRPGLGGRPFRIYKFRTLLAPRDTQTGAVRQPCERETRLGHVLRSVRLDELPQLWNILIGDMSFVGPRPLLPVDQSERDRARLLVRPGLTGLAQTTGGRLMCADDKAAFDVWYILNASLIVDLKIFAKTISVIVRGERQATQEQVHLIWRDVRQKLDSPSTRSDPEEHLTALGR